VGDINGTDADNEMLFRTTTNGTTFDRDSASI